MKIRLRRATLSRYGFGCALSAVFAIGLTACGGDADPDASVIEPSSVRASSGARIKQAIHKLEQSGQIPVLDRSDDVRGPDKNGNGIRDDIDAYIETKGYTPSQKTAVQQLARSMQADLLVDTNDDRAVRGVVQRMTRAIHCVSDRLPSPQWENSIDEYKKITMNTKARALAYDALGQALSGKGWSLPEEDTCDA